MANSAAVSSFMAAVRAATGGGSGGGADEGTSGLPPWAQAPSAPTGPFNNGSTLNPFGRPNTDPQAPFNSARDESRRQQASEDATQEWAQEQRLRGRRAPRLVEISDADYATMSDEQKAAVDYNTAYYRAVTADLAAQATPPDPNVRQEYDAIAKELFGDTAGDTYAPNTVAFLKAAEAPVGGASAEDLLELRGGITGEEIDRLAAPGDTTDRVESLPLPTSTGRQARIDETLAGARALAERVAPKPGVVIPIDDFAGASFSDQVGAYISKMGLGIGETQAPSSDTAAVVGAVGTAAGAPAPESDFEMLFHYTMNRANENDWNAPDLYASLEQNGYNPDDFASYVEERLRRAEQGVAAGYQIQLSRTPDEIYLDPQEYRSLLGLTTG